MSQIFKAVTASSLPPSVPEAFTTQNGTAVPAANILIVNGIDSTENNANGIITKGGVAGTGTSNEVDVVITNRLVGTATVVGAVTGDIVTFPLGASPAVYRMTFIVAGRDLASGDGVGYTIDGSIRTNGAAATVISTANIDADEDASLSTALIAFIASGNNMIIQSTGVVGRAITYNATGTYVVI